MKPTAFLRHNRVKFPRKTTALRQYDKSYGGRMTIIEARTLHKLATETMVKKTNKGLASGNGIPEF